MINSARYYDSLYEISVDQHKELPSRIKELKHILQSIATDYTSHHAIQFPSIYARLDFIFRKENIRGQLKSQLGAFRFNTKNAHLISAMSEGHYYGYLISVTQLIAHLSGQPIPDWFTAASAKAEVKPHFPTQIKKRYPYLIGYVWDKTTTSIVLDADQGNRFDIPLGHPNMAHLKNEYADTIALIEIGDKIALLDVKVDDANHCIPLHIVYQPDYLLDVSALAACFHTIDKETISPWQLYFIKRLIMVDANPALLKGNVVNFLMDELLYASRKDTPVFTDLIKKSFKNNAFEYMMLFKDNDMALRKFIGEVKAQFVNLKRVLQLDFSSPEININTDNAVLEPAFINNTLGLQGRLDLLDKNAHNARIIELKSGACPYPQSDSTQVSDGHAAQARMYRMLLKQVYGMDDNNIQAAICYSSANNPGENIRWVSKYVSFDMRILNMRNTIVSKERNICAGVLSVSSFFKSLEFDAIGIQLHPKLEWFRKDWDKIQTTIEKLDPVERKYFFSWYQFVIQELMLSKIGDGKYHKGHSALWNKEDISENEDNDRITPLEISQNDSDDEHQPCLTLRHMEFDANNTYNFRKGDIAVLFQINSKNHLATSGQIYKCSIYQEMSKDGFMSVFLGINKMPKRSTRFSIMTFLGV